MSNQKQQDRNSLIGLATVVTLVVLSLVLFPFMRELVAIPFIFIAHSVQFVFESIGAAVGMLF